MVIRLKRITMFGSSFSVGFSYYQEGSTGGSITTDLSHENLAAFQESSGIRNVKQACLRHTRFLQARFYGSASK